MPPLEMHTVEIATTFSTLNFCIYFVTLHTIYGRMKFQLRPVALKV